MLTTSDRPAHRLLAPLCFVHIPKTAGGTLRNVLTHIYTKDVVANAGNWLNDPVGTLEKVGRKSRSPDRVLGGHVPYSVYRANVQHDARHITILRDTVDRVFSHYVRHLHGRRINGSKELESVTQALRLGLREVRNLSTRFLCDDPSADLSSAALESAKRNLRRFVFVGLQEHFDESVVLLHRALGLDHLVCPGPDRHVNEGRPSVDAIPDADRQAILEHNALDVELYAYARELFGEMVATFDDGLAADVGRLRALRAPIFAASQSERRKARVYLESELAKFLTHPLLDLRASAIAAGIDETALRDEMKAMRSQRRAVNLIADDETRYFSSDPRFLAVNKGTIVYLSSEDFADNEAGPAT